MLNTFLINYWKNIKHIFTCLGIFFLFLCAGISVLLRGLYKVVLYVVDGISDLIGTASENISAYINSIVESITNDILSGEIEPSKEYLNKVFVDGAVESFNETTVQANTLVNTAMEKATAYFVTFGIILFVGIVVSFILTRKYVRGSMLKGKFFRRLLISIPYLIVIIGLPLLALSTKGVLEVILTILAIIVVMLGSLFEAYLIHRKDNITFKEVVNIKNSLMLIISELICVLASILLIVIFYLIEHVLGLIVIIPVIIVALTVMGANAESYVISLVEKNNLSDKNKIVNEAELLINQKNSEELEGSLEANQ